MRPEVEEKERLDIAAAEREAANVMENIIHRASELRVMLRNL